MSDVKGYGHDCPCKGCGDRQPGTGCHDRCERFLEWKQARERANEVARKYQYNKTVISDAMLHELWKRKRYSRKGR